MWPGGAPGGGVAWRGVARRGTSLEAGRRGVAEGGVAEARSGRLAAMCCPLPLEGLAVEGWGVVQHRGRRGGGGVEPVQHGRRRRAGSSDYACALGPHKEQDFGAEGISMSLSLISAGCGERPLRGQPRVTQPSPKAVEFQDENFIFIRDGEGTGAGDRLAGPPRAVGSPAGSRSSACRCRSWCAWSRDSPDIGRRESRLTRRRESSEDTLRSRIL